MLTGAQWSARAQGRPLGSTNVDKMWREVGFSGCEVVLWRPDAVDHWLMASGHSTVFAVKIRHPD